MKLRKFPEQKRKKGDGALGEEGVEEARKAEKIKGTPRELARGQEDRKRS